MKDITDKLAAINAPIGKEDQVVTLLLGSLPESFATEVTALKARWGDTQLEFVRQTLLNKEHWRCQSSS